MGQPTKSELQAEVEELRTSLDQAHGILTRALGYDEPEAESDPDDPDEDEEENEDEDQ